MKTRRIILFEKSASKEAIWILKCSWLTTLNWTTGNPTSIDYLEGKTLPERLKTDKIHTKSIVVRQNMMCKIAKKKKEKESMNIHKNFSIQWLQDFIIGSSAPSSVQNEWKIELKTTAANYVCYSVCYFSFLFFYCDLNIEEGANFLNP